VQHAGQNRLTTGPYQGVPITVVNMQRAVRQALELEQSAPVQRLVRQILASVRPADDVSEIAAINYWLLDNLKYLKDPVHVERVISPIVALAPEPWDRAAGRRAGQGDCAALSMSAATLLAAAVMARGTRTSFLTVSMDPKMPEHHVFVVARLPNKQRLVLDPVAGPYVSRMLQSVVRYHEWPVEPVWTGRGFALGRAA